jgi:hypothetical protein
MSPDHYDLLKQTLRQACIMYSQMKARVKRAVVRRQTEELDELAGIHRQTPDHDFQDRLEFLQASLDQHWQAKIQGKIKQSRVRRISTFG